MRHQDTTLNHRLESWVFATKALREAAGSYVSTDVSRIAYQTDTGEYYRMTATTPTWALIALPSTAAYAGTVQSPTGTIVTSPGVMAGLGSATYGSAAITPVRSGRVFVTINGSTSNTGTGGVSGAIRYGTGIAPANGAGATGTQPGGAFQRSALGAGMAVPFSLSAIITGLTLGTVYWLDLVQILTGTGTASVGSVCVSAFELP